MVMKKQFVLIVLVLVLLVSFASAGFIDDLLRSVRGDVQLSPVYIALSGGCLSDGQVMLTWAVEGDNTPTGFNVIQYDSVNRPTPTFSDIVVSVSGNFRSIKFTPRSSDRLTYYLDDNDVDDIWSNSNWYTIACGSGTKTTTTLTTKTTTTTSEDTIFGAGSTTSIGNAVNSEINLRYSCSA